MPPFARKPFFFSCYFLSFSSLFPFFFDELVSYDYITLFCPPFHLPFCPPFHLPFLGTSVKQPCDSFRFSRFFGI